MAYQMQEDDLFRVSFYNVAAEQEAINSALVKVHNFVPANVLTDQDLADRVSFVFSTLYQSYTPTNVTYQGASVRRIEGAGLPPVTAYSRIGNGPGLRTSDLLPRQTCGLIKLMTVLRGPRYRGRWYLPFPPEDLNDPDATPSPLAITFFQAIQSELTQPHVLIAGAATCDYAYGLNPPFGFASFQNGLTHDEWATQRRRSSFGRANRSPFA